MFMFVHKLHITDMSDPCASQPCMNNGTCFSSEFESSSSYFCICPPGLEGTRCGMSTLPFGIQTVQSVLKKHKTNKQKQQQQKKQQ